MLYNTVLVSATRHCESVITVCIPCLSPLTPTLPPRSPPSPELAPCVTAGSHPLPGHHRALSWAPVLQQVPTRCLSHTHLPVQETQVWPLGGEEPLEKEMAAHSSILA